MLVARPSQPHSYHREQSSASTLASAQVSQAPQDFAGALYRAVGNAKAPNPSYKNGVNVAMYTRAISYGSGSDCNYPDGIDNPNYRVYLCCGFVSFRESGWAVPGSAWSLVSSSWDDLPEPTEDGYAIQIRMYSLSQNSSGTAPMYIDNLRGEGT